MKIDLDPCREAHWWVQDGTLGVHCEYCEATGRIVIDTPRQPIAGRPVFLEPKEAS